MSRPLKIFPKGTHNPDTRNKQEKKFDIEEMQ